LGMLASLANRFFKITVYGCAHVTGRETLKRIFMKLILDGILLLVYHTQHLLWKSIHLFFRIYFVTIVINLRRNIYYVNEDCS
jgi:hypothetical protein